MNHGLPIHADQVERQVWDAGEIQAQRRRLGAAVSAARLGVALIEIEPGKRSTPPHSHADEDEVFLVLEGSGVSYQSPGSGTPHVRDRGRRPALAPERRRRAHADRRRRRATVLVVAEGSRTRITWLPRHRAVLDRPALDARRHAPPFIADAELGPLEIPAPTGGAPADDPQPRRPGLHEGREGRLAYASRDVREMGSQRLVLATTRCRRTRTTPTCTSTRPARSAGSCAPAAGSLGSATTALELRPGSFWLRRPNGGIGHRIEVGPDGMDLVTMGDLVGGDVCVYPEKGTVKLASGVEIPYPV